MAGNVVKRGGKPNRGGGRFPRGRGRGSRGSARGRGSGRGAPQQNKVEHHGHGGRKGADDYLADYDDGYDDDFEEPVLERGPNFQSGSDRSVAAPASQGQARDGNYSRPGQRPFRARGGPVKVTMQQLHMSTANQEMVKGMLKSLHGDVEITSDDEYEELDRRDENQYWIANNQLQIEGATAYEAGAAYDKANMTVSTLAVNKLCRYGFHKTRSTEALQVCDGDLGLALEYLLAKCFNLDRRSDTDTAIRADILEQRTDEMVALQAIFEDRFTERIQHKVWILKFSIPYLEKLTRPQRAEKSSHDSGADNNNLCRFYLRGFCKFGRRCHRSHDKPKPKPSEDSIIDTTGKECDCEVEIRFPNTYPEVSPYIAFSTTNDNMSKHICLNITAHMMKEAISMAKDQEPSIYTVVGCLEDEEFLDQVVQEPPHDFSTSLNSKPWLNRKGEHNSGNTENDTMKGNGSDSEEDLAIKTNTLLRMSDSGAGLHKGDNSLAGEKVAVKRSTSREEVKKGNPAEIIRQNRRLVDDFKRRKTSQKYRSMQAQREKLPAWDMQDDILSFIEGNQVVVISGMTGCGKTTQVPQFILDLYLDSGDLHLCNIVCTQPRRISAMAVAERVAEERADNLGRIVGYQIRLEKVQSSLTRLLFCTTGIVLRRLEGDSTLDGITHVIIDEVHERSEESDFLLMYLRDMLPERPDLKVILMSATMNAQLFSDFFGNCPVVDIPGLAFPVDQYFLEDAIEFTHFVMEDNSPCARPFKQMNAVRRGMHPDDRAEGDNTGPTQPASDTTQEQNLSVKQLSMRFTDYSKSTVKSLAMMDHMKINFDLIVDLMSWIVSSSHEDMEFPETGAILVFMPGYAEIQTLFDMLQSSSVFGVRNRHKYKIIPLHSTLSSEEQHAVFSKPPEGVTKIVIATNIAETSITIDDVVFVIDTGKMKEKRYDQTKGMESLDTVWVSRANALQRKGRAGRVKSGVCFHLFTSHRFEHHLQQQPIPEIQRAPLEQIVLRIRMLNVFRYVAPTAVLNKLPEPPDSGAINSAIKRLEDLGALDDKGELTPLGYHLGSLPVDVRIGKLMLFGAIFRCLDSALTIAACLSFKSPFVAPFGKKEEADERRLTFAAGNSDHLTMLKAYRGWLEARQKGGAAAYHFCQDNFLSQKSLQMLASMKQQFVELLSDIGFVKEGILSRDIERAARGRGDGVLAVTGDEANCNALNWKLVSAVLVGALYPNVIQVLTPESKYAQTGGGAVVVPPKAEELKFKTKPDGYVNIHPSSVNFQVRHYESPYLVYHEKVKTTKIYIRDCTMVSVYPLLLFGGGSIAVDLSRGNFILSVDDGWIRFMAASHQIAELVRELRLELDQLLSDKIQNPHMDLCTCPRGSRIIDTIVTLITTQ